MLSRPPWALAASTRAWQTGSSDAPAVRARVWLNTRAMVVSSELAGEAVRGEQKEVARLGCVGGDLGLDRGLRAHSAGDDVADGRGRSLEAADEACANLLLDQRMVLGKELERATAEEIAAAVADMGQPEVRGRG